jgi:glutathione peroxidase
MGGAKASCANPYTSLYDIPVKTIGGGSTQMSEYRGKVLIIVNVASKWGLTQKNYEQLVQIDNQYRAQGLEILAFPCNQFLRQEPGTDEQIEKFVREKGANFKVFSKINVNGKSASDLFKFLRLHSNLDGGKIGWNFGKFVVNRDASAIEYYGPRKDPIEIVEQFRKFL